MGIMERIYGRYPKLHIRGIAWLLLYDLLDLLRKKTDDIACVHPPSFSRLKGATSAVARPTLLSSSPPSQLPHWVPVSVRPSVSP